jgi:hypothetical protein
LPDKTNGDRTQGLETIIGFGRIQAHEGGAYGLEWELNDFGIRRRQRQ